MVGWRAGGWARRRAGGRTCGRVGKRADGQAGGWAGDAGGRASRGSCGRTQRAWASDDAGTHAEARTKRIDSLPRCDGAISRVWATACVTFIPVYRASRRPQFAILIRESWPNSVPWAPAFIPGCSASSFASGAQFPCKNTRDHESRPPQQIASRIFFPCGRAPFSRVGGQDHDTNSRVLGTREERPNLKF